MKTALSVMLLGVALACSPGLPPCQIQTSPEFCQSCVPEIIETFILDKNFDPDEQQAVRDGAAMWNVATHGRVSFSFWVGTTSYEWPSVVKVQNQLDLNYVGMTRKPFIELESEDVEPDMLPGVAAHEFGHWLGLAHSKNPADLMYPQIHDCMVITESDLAAFKKIYP